MLLRSRRPPRGLRRDHRPGGDARRSTGDQPSADDRPSADHWPSTHERLCADQRQRPDDRPGAREAHASEAALAHVRCAELERWLGEGRACTILDVRTEAEWRALRIPGARLVPLHELVARLEEVLALPGPLVVHCAHGIRSVDAALYLLAQGRRDVLNVVEGISAWTGPTELGPPARQKA